MAKHIKTTIEIDGVPACEFGTISERAQVSWQALQCTFDNKAQAVRHVEELKEKNDPILEGREIKIIPHPDLKKYTRACEGCERRSVAAKKRSDEEFDLNREGRVPDNGSFTVRRWAHRFTEREGGRFPGMRRSYPGEKVKGVFMKYVQETPLSEISEVRLDEFVAEASAMVDQSYRDIPAVLLEDESEHDSPTIKRLKEISKSMVKVSREAHERIVTERGYWMVADELQPPIKVEVYHQRNYQEDRDQLTARVWWTDDIEREKQGDSSHRHDLSCEIFWNPQDGDDEQVLIEQVRKFLDDEMFVSTGVEIVVYLHGCSGKLNGILTIPAPEEKDEDGEENAA